MKSKLDGVELHLVQSVSEANELMSWLGERRDTLGFDVETSGLDPYEPGAKLRLVQLGDTRVGWAIPWEQWGGVAIEALTKWEGSITGHNLLAFDLAWMRQHTTWEPPMHRIHDTMVMARINNPTQPAGLKPNAARYVDPRSQAGERALKESMSQQGWDWSNIPVDFESYWTYSALDPVLTALLKEEFRTDERYPRVYELEMATRRICSEMEHNGAAIDVDYCNERFNGLNDYADAIIKWAKREFGIAIGSDAQLVAQLERDGIELTKLTDKGKKSVDKFVLQELGQRHPLAPQTLALRRARKLAGAYFKNFINNNHDGIVHPSINTMGARTGRMSVRNPALQTLPRGESLVRGAFIPRNEDNVLITSDLDQIELRMFSCFCDDTGLIDMFHRADDTGSDVFTEIGREVYNDPHMEKKDKRRATIKTMIYARLYGAGVEKQAVSAKLFTPDGVPDVHAMQTIVDAFDARYPGMKRYQQYVDHLGQSREAEDGEPWIESPYGRRLPADSGMSYKLVNYRVQSAAAEVFKNNLVKLDACGLTKYMVVPVHDEIVLDVPKTDVEEISRLVRECMTTRDGYAIPLTSDVTEPLARWGDRYLSDKEKAARAHEASHEPGDFGEEL